MARWTWWPRRGAQGRESELLTLGRSPTGRAIADLLGKVDRRGQPNLHALNLALRDIDLIKLNLKFFGYELARRAAEALPVREHTAARRLDLPWKASTQADLESDWVAHWCAELRVPVVMHRKLWELAYVLQAMHDHGSIRAGARGLGFGCGIEPLPSYLAAHGVAVTVTDQPTDQARSSGWADSNQHATSLDQAFQPHLVDRAAFDRLVSLDYVDMNAIPSHLAAYDFCWSVCAMEHLGSIERGLAFVENSLATLRPGGLSVHTTEFNIVPDGPTTDHWPTVLFQRRHFTALAERLRANGHHVAAIDFDIGDKPMDRFVDLPPWPHDAPAALQAWHGQPAHLKVGIDGLASTCFGIRVQKAG